ncbi:uncharacterized protein BcabD6B2_44840 [Babesia caballi]|uniref:Uncharacterized protein n=1 Tax=Babesia caballi TaxID=5871 RepID=A0AAV4LY79_BABCB|nr:hypothetical protein, conserved [Babesia caballi]
MSKSLASFLDRRKKNTIKAAALLLQTEEADKEKQKAKDGVEEPQPEQQSDHDDEWKVSDDEEAKAFQNQAALSGSLMKSVRTVAGDDLADSGTRTDAKPTQHVWKSITEPPAKEETPAEAGPKVWQPKYRSGGGSLLTKNDVDPAEAARIIAAKSEHPSAKNAKKIKKKPASPRPPEETDDPAAYVKVKFNVFSVVDEAYHSFNAPHPNASLDGEQVKAKYIARPAYSGVA